MRNRMWILFLAISTALAAGAVSLAAVTAAENEQEMPPARAAMEPMGYTLAEYNGYIGLFEGERLILMAEVPVAGLRRTDRELITRGINADTYEQAMRLLEDFGA